MSTATATPETASAQAPANGEDRTASAAAQQVKPERAMVKFDADNPVSLYMDSAVFEQLQRVGRMMASSSLVPEHFRGDKKTGDCALVAAQSFRWRMDPFAVVQHTFVLQGKLGYEGKLIAAVVNSSSKVETNLDYIYEGSGDARKVTVVGRLRGESKDRTVEGKVSDWKTSNDKWKSMPDQMLSYRGAREWARRHMPEVLLGVYADEEVKEIVELERGADGAYQHRPTTLDDLADRMGGGDAAAPAETKPAEAAAAGTSINPETCNHGGAKKYLNRAGLVIVCPDCESDVRLEGETVILATAKAEEAPVPTKTAEKHAPKQRRLEE